MDIVLVSSRARLGIQGTAHGYIEAVWLCGSYVLQREDVYIISLVPVGVLWLTSSHVSRSSQASMLGSSSLNLHIQNIQFTRHHHLPELSVLQTLGCVLFF